MPHPHCPGNFFPPSSALPHSLCRLEGCCSCISHIHLTQAMARGLHHWMSNSLLPQKHEGKGKYSTKISTFG